jgi:arsenate reductase
MDLTIFHNPRCRKSRETLQIIIESGTNPIVVEYLKTTPSKEELQKVIEKLGINPESLVRKGERVFKDNFKGKSFNDQEWLEILANHPVLIERPIVIKGESALIGRPPENVKSFL